MDLLSCYGRWNDKTCSEFCSDEYWDLHAGLLAHELLRHQMKPGSLGIAATMKARGVG